MGWGMPFTPDGALCPTLLYDPSCCKDVKPPTAHQPLVTRPTVAVTSHDWTEMMSFTHPVTRTLSVGRLRMRHHLLTNQLAANPYCAAHVPADTVQWGTSGEVLMRSTCGYQCFLLPVVCYVIYCLVSHMDKVDK